MSTLQEWIGDLGKAAASVEDETEKVVSKGALNIKQDWARRWRGLGHLPHLPSTVGYDLERAAGVISAEIGPDTGKLQGSVAHIIELGSLNSAPHPGGIPALDAEEPKFIGALEDLGETLLEEGR